MPQRAIGRRNLKGRAVVEELRRIGFAQRRLGVPDMGGFRAHTVDFDDAEALSGAQATRRLVTDVKPAEVKIGDRARDLVEPRGEFTGHQLGAVAEGGALAVVADEDELHALAGAGHLVQPGCEPWQVEMRHLGAAWLGHDELAQVGASVPHHHGRGFQRHGGDGAGLLAGTADVEEAGFSLVGNERLKHEPGQAGKGGEVAGEVGAIVHEADAGAVATDVGLHHDREIEAGSFHRGFGDAEIVRFREGAGGADGIGRYPIAADATDLVKNGLLRFPA
jgi:hypothetical protein